MNQFSFNLPDDQVTAPRYPTWGWFKKIKDDEEEHFLACLTDSYFYIGRGFASTRARMDAQQTLNQAEPSFVFRKNAVAIPLDKISELRCSDQAALLEIIHGGDMFTIADKRQARAIFEALRSKIAANVPIEQGAVSVKNSALPWLFTTLTVAAFGAFYIAESFEAVPGREFHGRSALWRSMTNEVMLWLGTTGTIAVVVALVAGMSAFTFYRYITPQRADVVAVPRGSPSSQ